MPPTPADMPLSRPKRQRAPQYAAGRLLSRHARLRMQEFGLSKDDVADVLRHFENRYSQGGRYDGNVYQRGAWGVITCRDDVTVVTVVRRQIDRWEH